MCSSACKCVRVRVVWCVYGVLSLSLSLSVCVCVYMCLCLCGSVCVCVWQERSELDLKRGGGRGREGLRAEISLLAGWNVKPQTSSHFV